MNDDYLSKNKGRRLKARRKGGMKAVMSGDADFDAEEEGRNSVSANPSPNPKFSLNL